MATCAEIVGAKLPDNAGEDSVSILPVLLGSAEKPVREAVVHHSINGAFAIRQGQWKLLLCAGSGGWAKGGNPGETTQLYDMARDPGEQANQAEAEPEIAGRLTTLLEKYVADGRSTPGTPQKNDVPIVIRKNGGKPKAAKK
jgi:arylsulfatase A-like enzyme